MYGLDNKLSVKFWSYVETLRDPILVSKFQNYFGVRVVNNETNVSKHLKTKSQNTKTTNQLNGYHKDLSLDSYQSSDEQKKVWTQDSSPQVVRHRRELSECSSLCNTCDTNNNSKDETQNYQSTNYVIENQFWYYLFRFGASLGYELFYAIFFPIWFWNIDSAVGRRLVWVWVIVMYLGQALKDLVKWSRPQGVVVMEPEYALEYGFPSTHAMVGTALPFSLIIFTTNKYDYSLCLGMVFALLWCALVCVSRLYLGMHSVMDIMAGLVLSALLMVIIIPFVDSIDWFHLTSPYTPVITIPLIVFLDIVFPKTDRWSPARVDTCVIMGSGAGLLFGCWLNYHFGITKIASTSSGPLPISWPGYEVIGLSLLRQSVGILCVVFARVFGKLCIKSFICYVLNVNPKDPKNKLRVAIVIPSTIITYMLMGWTVTYLSPVVFRFLNIERLAMYTEI